MTDTLRPSIAVVVASLGRAEALGQLLGQLAIQSHRPERVILSLEGPQDCPPLEGLSLPVEVIHGPRGSSVQRNRALDRLTPDTDLVAIVDDDYLPSQFFLEDVARAFAAFPQASGLGGVLLADGALGPGVSFDAAQTLIAAAEAQRDPKARPRQLPGMRGVYGCNMVFRQDHIGAVRFDEAVPLYGWLEDSDFGARLPGPFLYTDAFFGVHRAEKSGRSGGDLRFGYSQICNPIYFWRKGTLSTAHMLSLILRPLSANLLRMIRPEPWISRAARFRGNLLALADLPRGRMHPGRILDL